MSKFNGVVAASYSQIQNQSARDLKLKQQPAVYSFYRSLNLVPYVRDEDLFIKELDKYFEQDLSATFNGTLGFLYNVELVERPKPLRSQKRDLLLKLTKSLEGREYIADIFESMMVMQSPLYIGKAKNLNRRVGEHVEGLSDLQNTLDSAGIQLAECSVIYKYLSVDLLELLDGDWESSEASVEMLFEDILTRIAPAAFVRRPG